MYYFVDCNIHSCYTQKLLFEMANLMGDGIQTKLRNYQKTREKSEESGTTLVFVPQQGMTFEAPGTTLVTPSAAGHVKTKQHHSVGPWY